MTGDGIKSPGKNPVKKSRIKTILRPGKQYSKKTFIRIFAGSAIIALAVLLVTTLVLYNSFTDVVITQSNAKSIELLKQTQSIFSSLHSWIIPSFFQINSEDTITSMIYSDRLGALEISAGLDRLDEISTSFNILQSIYIYNNRTGQYFSTINGFEGSQCSDFALANLLFNIENYGVYRYIPRKMTYRISGNVFREDFALSSSENVLTVIVGNAPQAGRIINGALVINLSEKKVRGSLLGAGNDSNSELVILSERGIVLTHPDPAMFAMDFSGRPYVQRILEGEEKEGVFVDTIDGEKSLISFTTHPFWGWRFINITPYDVIFSGLNTLVERTVILFVILMLLAVLVSFLSSLQVYLPFHRFFQYSVKIKDKFREPQFENTSGRLSELQYLDQTFKYMVKKANAFEHYIDETGELYRQEVLKAFLLGDIDADELESHREFVCPESSGGPFVLAVVRLDRFGNLSELHSSEEILKLFRIIREMAFHYNPGFKKTFLNMKKDHACIIYDLQATGRVQDMAMEEITQTIRAIQTAVNSELNCTCTVGISDAVADFHECGKAYRQSFDATQYRFLFGNNMVIVPGMISRQKHGNYVFPEASVKTLLYNLKLGKMPELERSLDEILESVKEHDFEDFVHMEHFIGYYTAGGIERMKESLHRDYDVLMGSIQEIKSSETLDELRKRLMGIFVLVHELLQEKKSHRTEDLALKIREYIDAHYTDPALCVDGISVNTGVSSCYIRFLFKKVFGISASEYITKLRLELCKDRLRKTKYTIKRIYQEAGYYNYSYFFTLFKKDTGLTPNQFRLQETGRN